MMNKQTNKSPGPLEREKELLVRRGDQQISDEIKRAVDLSYKLSADPPPQVEVETLTVGSSKDS